MPANADIKNGDILVTSGIDGVYPPGLSVAKVVQVESKSNDAFARIVCQPLAGIDRNRQLLILLTAENFPPRPAPPDPKDLKSLKKAAPSDAKDVSKDAAHESKKQATVSPAQQPAPSAESVPETKTVPTVSATAGAAKSPAAPGTAQPAAMKPATPSSVASPTSEQKVQTP
jgi:rod shape-determining protein MreC